LGLNKTEIDEFLPCPAERKAAEREAKREENRKAAEADEAMAASVKAKPKKVRGPKDEMKELEAALKAVELEKQRKKEEKAAARKVR
jgi:hypothetical protein